MLLMIEKDTICGICHIIRRYVKANNKCKKYYDKQKNHLRYCYINNLHEYAMQRKLRVGGFKWVKNISKLNENFINKKK